MNILLVDDDVHMLKSLQRNINWQDIGLDPVYTATSMYQAKEILEQYQINILLCDIEMPHGSGLDLIAWIRERNLPVEALILTSYPNFNYVQRAMSLDSIEYYLKPVHYDQLTEGLLRAIKKCQTKQQVAENQIHAEYWKKSADDFADYFWSQIINGYYENDDNKLFETMKSRILPWHKNSRMLPMLIRPLIRNKSIQSMSVQHIRNIISTSVTENDNSVGTPVILIKPQEWIILLELDKGLIPIDEQKNKTQRLIDTIRSKLQSDLFVGVGEPCFIYEIYQALKVLREMLEDDVISVNTPLLSSEYEPNDVFYDVSRINALRSEIEHGDTTSFYAASCRYLEECTNKGKINQQFLKLFRVDITQIIYAFLRQQHIPAHERFSDAFSEQLYVDAIASVQDMERYVEHLVGETASGKQKDKKAITQLTEYLDAHYCEEISRTELAQIVFLNPDYVSRLFRKETGKSISEYIVFRRMERAKSLLETRDIPINEVATAIGYDSFAYFSKLFKQATNYTPSDYRKLMQGKKRKERSENMDGH